MEQQVEIDAARAPEGRAGAAENFGFDQEEPLQQFTGGKRRVKPQDCIVERGLVGNANGRGLIEWGKSRDLAIGKPGYFGHRAQQVQFAVSHVGAEGYVGIRLH